MSRAGWAVVDDSQSLVFDQSLAGSRRAPTLKTWTCTSSATGTITWAACATSARVGGRDAAGAALGAGQLVERYWEYSQDGATSA